MLFVCKFFEVASVKLRLCKDKSWTTRHGLALSASGVFGRLARSNPIPPYSPRHFGCLGSGIADVGQISSIVVPSPDGASAFFNLQITGPALNFVRRRLDSPRFRPHIAYPFPYLILRVRSAVQHLTILTETWKTWISSDWSGGYCRRRTATVAVITRNPSREHRRAGSETA